MEREAVLDDAGIDNGLRYDMNDWDGGGGRVKLFFMGNKPALRWKKNPALYFLMMPRESSLEGWTQPDIAYYFSIGEKKIKIVPWVEANAAVVREGKDSFMNVTDFETMKRAVIPFSTRESFKFAVYPETMLEDVNDYARDSAEGKRRVVKHISKLYGRLRSDFDYALDSTRPRWQFSTALSPVHRGISLKQPEIVVPLVGTASAGFILSYLMYSERNLLAGLGLFGATASAAGLGMAMNQYFNKRKKEREAREAEGLVEKIEED